VICDSVDTAYEPPLEWNRGRTAQRACQAGCSRTSTTSCVPTPRSCGGCAARCLWSANRMPTKPSAWRPRSLGAARARPRSWLARWPSASWSRGSSPGTPWPTPCAQGPTARRAPSTAAPPNLTRSSSARADGWRMASRATVAQRRTACA
jgi:hypothetical protein